jgi:hypothetical protein
MRCIACVLRLVNGTDENRAITKPLRGDYKMKKFLIPCIVLGLFLTAGWFAACQKDPANNETTTNAVEAIDRTNANSKVFPPSAHPYGKSYAEWSVLWLQQFMAFDCATNPWLNFSDVLFYESGPVYFMTGIPQLGGSANITVPHGKALLFPLVNYINDYPCPAQYNFEPAPGQSLEDFLTEGAVGFLAGVTALEVTIDGGSVSNVQSYQFTSDLFYFTGDPSLPNCLDVCVTGSSQPAVGSGYYIMLKPLSIGTHTVHYHMEIPAYSSVQDGTINITVN